MELLKAATLKICLTAGDWNHRKVYPKLIFNSLLIVSFHFQGLFAERQGNRTVTTTHQHHHTHQQKRQWDRIDTTNHQYHHTHQKE